MQSTDLEIKDFRSSQTDWQNIALPVVLMLTGAILLGGDFLGMLSLENIQNFWPLALILTGLTELIPGRI